MEMEMEMEIQMKSKELITPSSPTPTHLAKVQQSSLDQLCPPYYLPVILYYTSDDVGDKTLERSQLMKKSLSEILTLFYPMAGRFNNDYTVVECNDHGALYLEAEANLSLAQFLQASHDYTLLNSLYPSTYLGDSRPTSPLLIIQTTLFSCGGMAICFCISHKTADAFIMTKFLVEWATACRSGIDQIKSFPSFDLASFFPPRDVSGLKPVTVMNKRGNNSYMTKCLVFDLESITRLKTVLVPDLEVYSRQPSKVVAVTAVIWRALIKAAEAKHKHLRPSIVVHPFNMRGKTNLGISENMCGNVIRQVIAKFSPDKDKMELHDLTSLLRTAITTTSLGCAKPVNGEELFMEITDIWNNMCEEYEKGEVDCHVFTSWSGFPLYEVDFGWGKPSWVSLFHCPVESFFLIPTKNGDGIEAWVSLEEDDMLHFQQDPDIVAFTSQKDFSE